MLYTKEMVSVRDIDLSEYNLGTIKQITVDDCIGEYDVQDYAQCFFMERIWRVNGYLDDQDIPFSLFCASLTSMPHLEKKFMDTLKILYKDKEIRIKRIDDEVKILVYHERKAVAFIDDSNFDMLCRVVSQMLYYNEPEKEVEEELQGNPEDIALFKKAEKEFKEKQRKKNEIHFEERVRVLIHMRQCFYDDIKNLTIWQFEDIYKTMLYIENYEHTYQFASSGNFKIKEIEDWRIQTKIKRS